MAKKKKRGGRRGILGKFGRKAASLIGTAVQLIGVGHGAIRAGTESVQDGVWKEFPRRMVRYYSGFDIDDGSFETDVLVKSALTIGVTYVIGRMIKQVARGI